MSKNKRYDAHVHSHNAETFTKHARGVPVKNLKDVFNQFTPGVDFTGCNKASLARSYADRKRGHYYGYGQMDTTAIWDRVAEMQQARLAAKKLRREADVLRAKLAELEHKLWRCETYYEVPAESEPVAECGVPSWVEPPRPTVPTRLNADLDAMFN